ncbi:MAG: DUF4235 domain-containing protein [Actinomycetaceae bacterium]|nr:DUF4235 domain-containing protein [Actinomycetaceae bacterium]
MSLKTRLISMGTVAVAGFIARHVVEAVWEKGLHQRVPTGDADNDEGISIVQMAAFAAVTAGVTSLVNSIISSKAERWNTKLEA